MFDKMMFDLDKQGPTGQLAWVNREMNWNLGPSVPGSNSSLK